MSCRPCIPTNNSSLIIVLNGHSNSGEGQRHRETRSERELERERGRERIHKSEWRGVAAGRGKGMRLRESAFVKVFA